MLGGLSLLWDLFIIHDLLIFMVQAHYALDYLSLWIHGES